MIPVRLFQLKVLCTKVAFQCQEELDGTDQLFDSHFP
jgi:hypothetical protein